MPKAIPFAPENFTEEELKVISEALGEYITTREEDESCQECSSLMESDEGYETNHDSDCPVAAAHKIRERLGVLGEGT